MLNLIIDFSNSEDIIITLIFFIKLQFFSSNERFLKDYIIICPLQEFIFNLSQ